MPDYRIKQHPILPIPQSHDIPLFWQGNEIKGVIGETIAAALFANGIRVFGEHPKDHSPQGIFCANGQCSQCMVIANEKPVKACMEFITPGMKLEPILDLPCPPIVTNPPEVSQIEERHVQVLIIGGGPAGLSAAIELGKHGIHTLLVDDKSRLGGKLVLQTHRFFGSTSAVYAGTRGIDIATKLEKQVRSYSTNEIWLKSTALAVFSDKKVGILRSSQYVIIEPEVLLVASGAREKFLAFQGNTLPGVYGAGAFQTLVNRDLVRPADNLFIVGGGNVGLIAGYHALQAGIGVIGLVEALPECGGYKVHKDKLSRMGVPIYTSHTILRASGSKYVESVTIAKVDDQFLPIVGSEKTFPCDSVLIAVGLDPVNEFYTKAVEYGLNVFCAGDAEEIAEASAAIFSGKIRGVEIANQMGATPTPVSPSWYSTIEILKSKPGKILPEEIPDINDGVMPVIHCSQEIPCNPCSSICPNGLIYVDDNDIRGVPTFLGNNYCCQYCEQCVVGCPGLAITLLDFRTNPDFPLLSIPYEFTKETIGTKDKITLVDTEGKSLGEADVFSIHSIPGNDRTLVVQVQAPKEYARLVAGIRIQDAIDTQANLGFDQDLTDDTIICRCERVTVGEIRSLIQQGVRDFNEIKTITRAGMGACGAKTCTALILRLFKEEGVKASEITASANRPLFIEVPLEKFAGVITEGNMHE